MFVLIELYLLEFTPSVIWKIFHFQRGHGEDVGINQLEGAYQEMKVQGPFSSIMFFHFIFTLTFIWNLASLRYITN